MLVMWLALYASDLLALIIQYGSIISHVYSVNYSANFSKECSSIVMILRGLAPQATPFMLHSYLILGNIN